MRMIIIIMLMYSLAHAAPVTLMWDPPVDTEGQTVPVDGYRLHRGTVSGQYTTIVEVGDTHTATLEVPNGQWFIAVTAFRGDVSSGYSNEVMAQIGIAPPTSVLPNGDMESGIWQSGAFSGTSPRGEWTTGDYLSPTHSLLMYGVEGRRYYGYWLSPFAPVVPGKRYAMAWWLRLVDVTTGVQARIDWYNASGAPVSGQGIGRARSGTLPWTQYRVEVTPPPQAAQARIQFRTDSIMGSSFLDDVTLVPLEEPPRVTPEPVDSLTLTIRAVQ